jgi:hypothetical protein
MLYAEENRRLRLIARKLGGGWPRKPPQSPAATPMKESASVAWQWVQKNCAALKSAEKVMIVNTIVWLVESLLLCYYTVVPPRPEMFWKEWWSRRPLRIVSAPRKVLKDEEP